MYARMRPSHNSSDASRRREDIIIIIIIIRRPYNWRRYYNLIYTYLYLPK